MAYNILESRLIPFNLQIGSGTPVHISPAGSIYFDRIYGTSYQNINGNNVWVGFGGGSGSSFTGGTVTGPTNFLNGISTTTISATTYYNLPKDIYVTGGTYASGTAIFTNNSGGTFSIDGFSTGGGGGKIFFLNLSQSKGVNKYLSNTASTISEQSTGVTINSNSTSVIASFQSDVLNQTLIPGGIWSFYLHSYKENSSSDFDIFVDVYKLTSGGTSTLLFSTDPEPVNSNSPNPSMQLTDVYFSGCQLVLTDSIVAVVKSTNNTGQPHTITLVTEGLQHYSYALSSIPTQQGLTCESLSGCSVIQSLQNNKLDKSGGTVTNNLIINGSFSANTYLGLPLDIYATGLTLNTSNYDLTLVRNDGVQLTTNLGILSSDVTVTGGTYNPNSGSVNFVNNTGGTFTVNGFASGYTDVYVSGFTYDNNQLTIKQTNNQSYNVFISSMTGLTVGTLSATTYQNLPLDVYVTGGTYSNGEAIFTNNTGGTFNVSGFNTGTTTGFDVFVTGGTYSSGTTTFTNNTGGTFSVSGYSTDDKSIGKLSGDVVTESATASSETLATTIKSNLKTSSFGITIDGLGGVISLGQQGYVYIPYDGIITGWSMLGDQVGNCIIDVWKDSFGSFPPTSGDTIAGNQKPTLSSQSANRNLTLSSWTTSITSGDVIGFNVLSATSVTRVNLIISVIKT